MTVTQTLGMAIGFNQGFMEVTLSDQPNSDLVGSSILPRRQTSIRIPLHSKHAGRNREERNSPVSPALTSSAHLWFVADAQRTSLVSLIRTLRGTET